MKVASSRVQSCFKRSWGLLAQVRQCDGEEKRPAQDQSRGNRPEASKLLGGRGLKRRSPQTFVLKTFVNSYGEISQISVIRPRLLQADALVYLILSLEVA